ncbi:hypothetical protein [Williamsia sp.]|uniref:hypothetical protein n=1 Tax=Williamsia sp. TaxID=1872085 RepID=UPI001A263916|nr:hypothetical protein [Williamsia sp.]MBJ7287987.1 hypothetical protein [Williamsia sp.]
MSEPVPSQDFARLKLNGERFAGARLPVSALSELENYTNLIREAAKLAWRDAHPGEDLPQDFGADFDLVLTSVHNGSADCHLERLLPHSGDEDDYFDQSRERVGRELRQVLQGRIDETDELLARIDSFGELGSSLSVGDSLEVPSYDSDDEPVRITRSSYREYVRPAHERSLREPAVPGRPRLKGRDGWLVGRLFAVSSKDTRFELASERYGDVHGFYAVPEILDDLRAVLGTSKEAPVVRIFGRLQYYSENDFFRMRNASLVQVLEVDGQPWSRRFIELASLEEGWDDDDSESQPVSFAALDGARHLLSHARSVEIPQPGIFPLGDGGVSLEWASPDSIYSIEISPEADVTLFHLGNDDIPHHFDAVNFSVAESFITGVEL